MEKRNPPKRTHFYKGTLLPYHVTTAAVDALENFEFRKDDVLLTGYGKSGTHWINEVIHLILRDGDSSKLDHRHRRDCIELTEVTDLAAVHKLRPNIEIVKTDPSPRVLKTHLRPSVLPKKIWTNKIPVIYILRNPKDVFLSLFDFMRYFTDENGDPCTEPEDFEEVFQDFVAGNVPYDGWCEHVTSYESLIGKVDNILFVTYESMKKDLPAVINSIAKHVGHNVNDEVINKIVANTTIEAMQRNYVKAMATRKQEKLNAEPTHLLAFLQKGVAGRWKTEYSSHQWKILDEVFKEKVKDTVYAKQYFE